MPNKDERFLWLLQQYINFSITEDELAELYNEIAKDEDRLDLFFYFTNARPTENKAIDIDRIYHQSALKYKKKEVLSPPSEKPIVPKRSYKRFAKLLFLLPIIILGFLSPKYFFNNTEIVLSTEKGERKFFRLKDGTEIWLNGVSSLRFNEDFGTTNRNVELLGEGYFNVTKNKDMPFILKAYDNEIRVLGTKFNVFAYPDEDKIETSLFEGKIVLAIPYASKLKKLEMMPGEKVVITKTLSNGVSVERIGAEKSKYLSTLQVSKREMDSTENNLSALWRHNKLVFQNESFAVVVRKLERWYGCKIIVENQELLDNYFTGVFEEQSCEEVLNLLKRTGVSFKIKNNNKTFIIY
ncbi:FecR family protein [Sphingobacteriaceae bacterium WQ 2009]|uniref:FecR family protein n=1 Tax=Rhinopithecimicrobium faecis TaxID=2820698 RepID=A0A8T4HBY7_9SPHI|nr:FecR family protein [Sphingobacteriaceae bacterium WQ 2009]